MSIPKPSKQHSPFYILRISKERKEVYDTDIIEVISHCSGHLSRTSYSSMCGCITLEASHINLNQQISNNFTVAVFECIAIFSKQKIVLSKENSQYLYNLSDLVQ